MSGFGVFVTALAWGMTIAVTATLVALTLPWSRAVRTEGKLRRGIFSSVITGLAFLDFVGMGHALIFAIGLTVWIGTVFYFTLVLKGVRDQVTASSYKIA